MAEDQVNADPAIAETQAEIQSRLRRRFWRVLGSGLVPFVLLVAAMAFAAWQVRDAQAPLEEIREGLERPQADAAEIVESVTDLAAQQDALEAQLAAIPTQSGDLPAKVAALVDERQVLERDLAETRETLATLRAGSGNGEALAALRAELDAIQARLEEERALRIDRERENAEMTAQLEGVAREARTQSAVLAETRTALEEAQGKALEREVLIARLEDRRQALAVQVETLQSGQAQTQEAVARAQAAEARASALSEERDRLAAALDEAQGRIAPLELAAARAAPLERRVTELTEVRDRLDADLESARQASAAQGDARERAERAEARALALGEERDRLAAALDGAQERIESQQAAAARVGPLEQRLAELTAARDRLDAALGEAEARLAGQADLAQRLAAAEARAEVLAEERDEVGRRLEAVRAELTRLRAGQPADAALEARMAELEALREALVAELRAALTTEGDLGAKLDAILRRIDELEGRLASPSCEAPAEPEEGVFRLYFDLNRAQLQTGMFATLARVARVAAEKGAQSIVVAGHTDRSGDDDYNFRLSERRARNVALALRRYLDREGLGSIIPIDVPEGEGKPDVVTEDGVPEPCNRRVRISLN